MSNTPERKLLLSNLRKRLTAAPESVDINTVEQFRKTVPHQHLVEILRHVSTPKIQVAMNELRYVAISCASDAEWIDFVDNRELPAMDLTPAQQEHRRQGIWWTLLTALVTSHESVSYDNSDNPWLHGSEEFCEAA